MDSNSNRLHLNFDSNQQRLPLPNDRTYPTTPSTFPQPVFPPQSGQQAAGGAAAGAGGGLHPQQQPYAGQQYAGQGYFAHDQYAPQYAAAPQVQPHDSRNNQYQPRSNTPGNDPNQGLAHQFSHQNLGGAQRNAAAYARGPSSAQRPRTAGSSGQQQPPHHAYASAPPVPSQGSAPVPEFQQAPERNSDKYGANANSNQKKCSQLAADFFKDSVKRARERNQRYISSPVLYPRQLMAVGWSHVLTFVIGGM